MELIGECKGNNGNGCFMDSSGHNCGCFVRKPKQETLEEAFDKIDDKFIRYSTEESEFWTHYKIGVMDGLQYKQERSYSEEKVLELIQFLAEREDFKEYSSMSIFIAEDFLNQFKNK